MNKGVVGCEADFLLPGPLIWKLNQYSIEAGIVGRAEPLTGAGLRVCRLLTRLGPRNMSKRLHLGRLVEAEEAKVQQKRI